MRRIDRLLEELEEYEDKGSLIELAEEIKREVRKMEKDIRDALLERSRIYALRSKAARRAAERSKNPAERELMEEKARIFLKVSREYFAAAMSLTSFGEGEQSEQRR
jgi:hypothetical protein